MSATLHQNPRTRALPRAERDAEILRRRSIGQPLTLIAEKVGASERTCRRVVNRRIEELNRSIVFDSAQLVGQHLLETEMLRARLAPLLVAATPGERLGAVRAWVAVLEREARLLGLDAPARIEVAARNEAAAALLQRLADALPAAVMEQIVEALTDGV